MPNVDIKEYFTHHTQRNRNYLIFHFVHSFYRKLLKNRVYLQNQKLIDLNMNRVKGSAFGIWTFIRKLFNRELKWFICQKNPTIFGQHEI